MTGGVKNGGVLLRVRMFGLPEKPAPCLNRGHYALVGERPELGRWGKEPSGALICRMCEATKQVPMWVGEKVLFCSRTDLPALLEFRVVVVEEATKMRTGVSPDSDEKELTIRFVDHRFTRPSEAPIQWEWVEEGSIATATVTIDMNQGDESCLPLQLLPVARGLRCQHHITSTQLCLSVYGCDSRTAFKLSEWQLGLPLSFGDLSERRNRVDGVPHSSLFEPTGIRFERLHGAAWGPFAPGVACCPEAVESLTYVPPLLSTPSPIAVAGAGEAAKSPDASLMRDVTAECWNVTLDMGSLQGWVPVLQLASRVSDDDGRGRAQTEVPLLPSLFPPSQSTGTLSIPVFLVGSVPTTLFIQYLRVSPFRHPQNSLRVIRSMEAWDHLTLDTLVGHRGLGKTYTSQNASIMKEKLAENSLESLNAAHSRGCQCVEFDVMLTKDYVPIILHDPILKVDARGKPVHQPTTSGTRKPSHHTRDGNDDGAAGTTSSRRSGTEHHSNRRKSAPSSSRAITSYDTLPVAVHQLTYRQLLGAVTKVLNPSSNRVCRLRELMLKHWEVLLDMASKAARGVGEDGGESSDSRPSLGTTPLSVSHTPPLNSSLIKSLLMSTSPPHGVGHSSLHHRRHLDPTVVSRRRTTSKYTEASTTHRFITNHIPSLQELFDGTPSTLRLDLEVKFPFQPKGDAHLYLQTNHFNVDAFVTAILVVVFDNVLRQPEREIVFSSFEPDVCIALMQKQSRFHVLYISDTEEHVDFKDYRCFELETAIQFAASQNLAGIAVCATSLMSNDDKTTVVDAADLKSWTQQIGKLSGPRVPSLSDATVRADQVMVERWSSLNTDRGHCIVNCAHAHGLKVWTWGDRNQDPHFAYLQAQEMQVDAVISDNVPLWSNAHVGRTRRSASVGSDKVIDEGSSSVCLSDETSPARSDRRQAT